MIRTTPFHERTSEANLSGLWEHWSGYLVAQKYQLSEKFEYFAIRNSAGLFDSSPLYKYRIHGADAASFLGGVLARDIRTCAVGHGQYTAWLDDGGFVVEDGVVFRTAPDDYLLTCAEPNQAYFTSLIGRQRVTIEDVSEESAVLSIQGPRSRDILGSIAPQVCDLPYFGLTGATIGETKVTVSRTGYTGDLGYELWMPWDRALQVWDAIASAGPAFDLHPTGMLALDVARIEAGLLLIDVDFHSSRKALIETQKYSPYELNFARLVDLKKGPFVGRAALNEEVKRGIARQIVGLEIDWTEVEKLYDAVGLPPTAPAATSRVAVPVYKGRSQIGRATSTTWSSTLKKLIALATLDAPHYALGTRVEMEMTVEAVRHRATATVVTTPFFNPPRKTSAPFGPSAPR
jgi:aminomethyltransferase